MMVFLGWQDTLEVVQLTDVLSPKVHLAYI